MISRSRFWIIALALSAVTFAGLNFLLMAEIADHRAGRPAIDATLDTALEEPEFTAYLLFSPAQCSSHYLSEIAEWQRIFDRFHGSRVWVQPVATYTSRAELGRLWDGLGYKLAVHVDPEGSIADQLGLTGVPAKVIVNRNGEIVYRESYPELYPIGRLESVLEELTEVDSTANLDPKQS